MKTKIALLAIACLAASPAWAINKCTGADGKVVFQDAPCAGKGETLNVRPASGASRSLPVADAPTATPAGGDPAPGQAPMTEVQRIEKQIAESQKARRKQEFEVRLVPDAEAAIHSHRAQCDAEIRALQIKKTSANNNLAGATWEASISSEMAAVATRCDTRNRELRENAARLRAQCTELGGCR